MELLGTIYGGWFVPKSMDLNENSIIYSGGVGEDISFDLLLSEKYNCNIFLIDPTKRAKKHYHEILDYYDSKKWKFSGDIQKDYSTWIKNLNPNLNKINYINIGLWYKKDKLKFYKQNNEKYISQSIIKNMFGDNYDEVNVDSIKNIMETHNHNKIDLLKLDIEGAEIKVLNKMLDDEIYPKYLCVEFDLFLKQKDANNETREVINRLLENGYELLLNNNWNITFELHN